MVLYWVYQDFEQGAHARAPSDLLWNGGVGDFSQSGLFLKDPHGWLSKLWSPFGSPKYSVPYYAKDPKRDHSFDNHPYTPYFRALVRTSMSLVMLKRDSKSVWVGLRSIRMTCAKQVFFYPTVTSWWWPPSIREITNILNGLPTSPRSVGFINVVLGAWESLFGTWGNVAYANMEPEKG